MKSIYKNRIGKIKNIILKENFQGIIVHKNTDIFYLTGFWATENIAIVLITLDKLLFITDGRFINQFQEEVEEFDLISTDNSNNLFQCLHQTIKAEKINNLYFPYEDISYKNYLIIKPVLTNTKDSSHLIENLRCIKDDEEINYIKKAATISEQSFLALLNYIKPGMTEIEIKVILENEMSKRGCNSVAFPTIVASGSINGSLPHAIPTARKIKKGDFVTIDFGATYNNYCSDITRTIAVGEVDTKLEDLYLNVLFVKKECEKLLREGIEISCINKKATELIEKTGNKFLHSIGHGIGINIHESPSLNSSNIDKFKNNQVHTIEPGIYIKNIGGVRIEDDYLIKNDSYECLTPNITCDLIKI